MENVHLLLTGATGVIGAATLAEIAALFPEWRVTALVRAGDANAARARLEAAVASYGIRHMPPTWRVLPGDLGSLASLPASTLSGVSHVLNLAANTSHSAKRRAWEINVVQTKAMMERLLQIASIARIVHVSTAVTCGDSPAARLLREGDYPRLDDRYYTAYASSKAEAEHVLGGLAPKDRLCIAVPSIVVGHTRLGCAPSGSLYWGFRAVEALGFVTWPRQNRLDVVPSDWAARALLHLLTRPTLRHQRYHVSAGATSSINWNDLARTFACIKDPAAARSRYRIASPEAYQEAVARCRAAFGQGNVRHIATVLRHYRRFAEWNVVFSNRRLLAEGVPPPPRFTDYLELCERTSSGRSIVDQMSENAVDL